MSCMWVSIESRARLSEKEQQFILAFVKSSGSLKDMAKSMGISYPTVRNVLDDLIEKLIKMEEKWKIRRLKEW